METFPMKYWLKEGDQNQNGFIDRVDFRLLGCGGLRRRPGGGRPRCSYSRGDPDDIWDRYAKYIMVADENGDDKLSLKEIFDKTNTYLEVVFNTVDLNDDGFVSIDIINGTSIKITLNEIMAVFKNVFDVVDLKGENQINVAYDVPIVGDQLQQLDYNFDGKVNLQDAYIALGEGSPNALFPYILAQLSRTLDKDQDGIVHYDELELFLSRIFHTIDKTGDGLISLEDVFSFLSEENVVVGSVDPVIGYVESVFEFLVNEYIKIADQFLKEVDADNNGELSQEELNRVRSDLFDGVGHFRFRLGDFPVPPQNIWRFETYPDLLAMVASLLDDIEMEMLGIDLRVNKK